MAGRRIIFKPSTENNRSYYGKRAPSSAFAELRKIIESPNKKNTAYIKELSWGTDRVTSMASSCRQG